MNLTHVVILAIVEGLTEFLPISSTGHLVLVARLMQVPQTDFVKSFEIYIQLGAILAVIFLYWRKLWSQKYLCKKILLAFVPTAIAGLIAYKIIKELLLGDVMLTIWALGLGGVVLIFVEWIYARMKSRDLTIEKMSNLDALIVGVWQCLSLVPGVSRAGATIVGGLLLGMKRDQIVEFSFLLAVPTMLAASGLDLIKTQPNFTSEEWMFIVVGMVISFLTAMLAMKLFLKFVQHHTLIPFGIYRIAVALIIWLTIR